MVDIDISQDTGQELVERLKRLFGSEVGAWKNTVTKRFVIDTYTKFKIKPSPTANQPGNGEVKIGRSPRWSDLEKALAQMVGQWNNFLKKRVKDLDFEKETSQAFVLLLFEIARRVESPPYLTRVETQEAIAIALKRKSRDDAKPYIKDLIKMFRDRRRDFEHTKEVRVKAYNRIIWGQASNLIDKHQSKYPNDQKQILRVISLIKTSANPNCQKAVHQLTLAIKNEQRFAQKKNCLDKIISSRGQKVTIEVAQECGFGDQPDRKKRRRKGGAKKTYAVPMRGGGFGRMGSYASTSRNESFTAGGALRGDDGYFLIPSDSEEED